MSNALSGVKAKINRAEKHLADLHAEIAAFHRSVPYEILTEEDAATGDLIKRIKIVRPIPKEWGAIVGDVVHNLRSALDHLAVALVIRNGVTSDRILKDTYFPIGASKAGFPEQMAKRAGHAGADALRLSND